MLDFYRSHKKFPKVVEELYLYVLSLYSLQDDYRYIKDQVMSLPLMLSLLNYASKCKDYRLYEYKAVLLQFAIILYGECNLVADPDKHNIVEFITPYGTVGVHDVYNSTQFVREYGLAKLGVTQDYLDAIPARVVPGDIPALRRVQQFIADQKEAHKQKLLTTFRKNTELKAELFWPKT